MDFGTTISYVSFYLVSLAIFYYYFTTRNRERMAVIEMGANPDMFKSEEKYYVLLVIGLVAIGVSLGLLCGFLIANAVEYPNKSIIYIGSTLLFGGVSMLASFFILLKRMKKDI